MNKDFLDRYGNPDANGDGILDSEWFNVNIRVFSLPYPLITSWEPKTTITRFQAHRLAGDKIIAALTGILVYAQGQADDEAIKGAVSVENAKPSGQAWLRAHGYDIWGGCFNFRLVRGGNALSNHSWGTAVDYCPDIGRLGSVEDAASYPRFIVEAFKLQGFIWGGEGWARLDPMHFELA